MSVKQPSPLFLTDNIKMNGIPTKNKWKMHTLWFFISCCFILAFTSADQQISFSTNFLNSIQYYLKKRIFVRNFPFIRDSLNPPETPIPPPPNSQPTSAKHYKSFLLVLPNWIIQIAFFEEVSPLWHWLLLVCWVHFKILCLAEHNVLISLFFVASWFYYFQI